MRDGVFFFKNLQFTPNFKITYNLLFISFFPPQNTNNFKFNLTSLKVDKKIYVKQSYILLTWFYYLSFFKTKDEGKKNNIKIKYFPITRRIFTSTKAPMAHKTRSKEQFIYKYYKFLLVFKSNVNLPQVINSLDNALLFIFLTKKNFRIFETNLIFLKFFKFFFPIQTSQFLNFSKATVN